MGSKPPLTEPLKACILGFLIEMNDALVQNDKDRAIILYMDESFVHRLHLSAYSCFEMDKKGVVHYGFVHTSASGHRMTMVHAATKYGPHATRDVGGFPILENPSKPLANGRRWEGSGNLCEVCTAEFLCQPKRTKEYCDYHDAVTDKMSKD